MPTELSRAEVKAAVRSTLAELARRAPGKALEVRVPPYGATQCMAGGSHTRGTPRAIVETDPHTWLALCSGEFSWAEAVETGRVRASGERSDLTTWLPLS